MNLRILIGLACAFCATCTLAGDPVAGEALADTCVACHGNNGVEPISNYPIIGGQHESYLLSALLGYKNDSRSNAVMTQLVADFSETDLNNLAAYFAAQTSKLR